MAIKIRKDESVKNSSQFDQALWKITVYKKEMFVFISLNMKQSSNQSVLLHLNLLSWKPCISKITC